MNCIRLPVNYRHFEDDMNPRVFKKAGLKHLDRVIDIVCIEPLRRLLQAHVVTYDSARNTAFTPSLISMLLPEVRQSALSRACAAATKFYFCRPEHRLAR